jgi:integrase/recombinase XerD
MSTTITVDNGVKAYMSYHKAHSRPNTIRSFSYTLSRFLDLFSGTDITAVPEADVAIFLEVVTDGLAQSTKSNRAGHLSAFFNFVKDTFNIDFTNPCSKGLIKKLYKQPRHTPPELLDKEIVDEIIYRTQGRERMMLELMGRTAMRVGEVMSMRPRDLNIDVSTIGIEQPKSGRYGEVVYLPQRMMRRMDDYVREHGIGANDRIFPISYTTAYRMVKRLGGDVGVKLRPHDLRRHAATQASRSGVPLEMVSKVILRHADIATTQRYLGKISVAEASRMIESWLG